MLKKILESAVSAFLYTAGFTCFVIIAIILLLVGIVHTGVFFDWLLKKSCRAVVICTGVRVNRVNVENCDLNTQYILMMNHVNFMDPFLAYGYLPVRARAVEEESHFKWPLYGWLVKRIGLIPINRKSGIKAMRALKKAGEIIRTQKHLSIAVLPEGTRTRTGKLGPFKKGGFLLALEAGLDILPMIQIGALERKTKGRWLLKPGKVDLIFEKPIPTSGYTRKTVDELIEKTRDLYLKYVE